VHSREDYFALVRERPELFHNPPGAGYTILLDEEGIRRAEVHMEQQLEAEGGSPEWARVGVAFRDQYAMIVRDAVRFPDGSLGTYIRFVSVYPGVVGVVALPIWRRQVLLIRHFRHATRSWHLEIPRGFGSGTDSSESARRELAEEIGAEVSRLVALGEVHPDSGADASRVALYLAEVESYGDAELQEGITEIIPTAIPELEGMIASGELEDGFLLMAYARAKARGLL
jgi:ADP-ribose pyrophosphatase